MPINKNALQAKINQLSSQTGVHQNILLKSFFFDAFLKRLASSTYSENFVFKGGFLLSTSLGINLRSTMDIDFLLRKLNLDRESIIKIIKDVVSIDIGDNITFSIQSIDEIRQEDDYGGYNVILSGRLDNIKEIVSVDIATGDPITPEAISYQYKCMFDNEVLKFKAYNFETILAEKLQTILFRGITNSRSKDFYDLYIIHKLKWNIININIFKKAFKNTCNYRSTTFSKEDITKILENISNDLVMETRWKSYRKRNKFVEGIEFKETINVISEILEFIF